MIPLALDGADSLVPNVADALDEFSDGDLIYLMAIASWGMS